jgi:hypothetical protein
LLSILKKIQRQEWPVDLLISKNGEWIENLTDKDHIRGALKHTVKPVLNKWAD